MPTPNRSQPLSAQSLAQLGLNRLAYIRPIVVDGEPAYAIHAADGTRLAAAAERATALALIRDHDIEPVSLH